MPLTSEIIFFFFLWKRKFGKCRRLFFELNQICVGLFGCLDRWRALLLLLLLLLYNLVRMKLRETLFIQVKLVEPVRPDFWLGNASNNNKYDTRTGQGTAVDKSEHSSRIELSRRWRWGDHSLFRLYWYFYFFEIQQEKTQTNQENAGPLVLTPTPLHRGYLILWIVDAWWFI
jgi:hypothetical protein